MEGIDRTEVRAGFIKLAVSDDGLTLSQVRNLRGAAQASRLTGAVLASHTANGALALEQMEVLGEEGLDPERFRWVHANLEPDLALHQEAARRGSHRRRWWTLPWRFSMEAMQQGSFCHTTPDGMTLHSQTANLKEPGSEVTLRW